MGYVWVTSPGASFKDSKPPESPDPFYSSEADIDAAKELVGEHGLTIVAESRLGLAVAGPPDAYRRLTDGKVVQVEQFVRRQRGVSHLDIRGDGQPEALGVGVPTRRGTPIEAVILEQPRLAFFETPSPLPPPIARQHLRVPDDVASLLGASQVHRKGRTGRGVTVAMVDSGHYAHPFFEYHGYRVESTVTAVPGTD